MNDIYLRFALGAILGVIIFIVLEYRSIKSIIEPMKQYIIIQAIKFAAIAFLIWFGISKYDSLSSPLNQSAWVYLLIYFPAVGGFANMIKITFKRIVHRALRNAKV